MTDFKIGDFVECIEKYNRISVGMTGIIRNIDNTGVPPILVEWDSFEGRGHDGSCGLPDNGYWVHTRDLRHSTFTLENE